MAAALAARSNHPLAVALAAQAGSAVAGTRWSDVQEHPGFGLEALSPAGARYRLGARDWATAVAGSDRGTTDAPRDAQASGEDGGAATQAAARHHATAGADASAAFPDPELAAPRSAFAGPHGLLAEFRFAEALRPETRATVQGLRDAGLEVALLSGDAPARVAAVAATLGIERAEGGATPADKLARVAALQQSGRRIGMVGDGLNDAPVMARADASFALGDGSALTRAKADFIVLSGSLADIAWARTQARRALRVVRQNLGWAIGYNAICVPLALAGWFPPWAAGLGMAASSLFVVLNALRIDRSPARTSPDPETT